MRNTFAECPALIHQADDQCISFYFRNTANKKLKNMKPSFLNIQFSNTLGMDNR